MKKLILALAMGALAVTASAQDKELKVAIDPTYEPFTFKTADGKPTGFDVDIANAVCEHLKRTLAAIGPPTPLRLLTHHANWVG